LRAQERWLNGFHHFRAEIDGIRVHFVHERARSGRGIPLVLTNGWPSCFAEFLHLVPRLTDPAAHGIEGPGFDVVIPSLPGYGFSDRPYTGPGSRPLSAAEQAYLAQYQRWREDDRGYGAIQSTRPQTLSYGLNDSPAGLAAWVLEKWRGWADSGGDIDATFSRDFLLTVVTLYWATQTIASSMRDYIAAFFNDLRQVGQPR
jgi:pimeloyl-ACP methyl ester carboxylesterase